MRFWNYGIDSVRTETMRVSGYFKVNKSLWETVVKDRYRSKGAIYWTHDPVEVSVTDEDVDKIIQSSYDPEVQDACVRLVETYQSAADEGCLILHDVAVPVTLPFTPVEVPKIVGWSKDKTLSLEEKEKNPEHFSLFDRPQFVLEVWSDREREIIENKRNIVAAPITERRKRFLSSCPSSKVLV